VGDGRGDPWGGREKTAFVEAYPIPMTIQFTDFIKS
jgi:hypothetical protein